MAAYVRRSRERGTDLHRGGGPGPRLSARTERRRLRRLVTRVLSPRFAFVIASRRAWAPTRRRVAMACVVQGLSMREAGAALGLSLHSVRRQMDAVEALYLASLERARTPRRAGGSR
ncbi:MAG: hypothetical protein H6810_03290 [Phycisphaeraceae bacterium]|nr:MAG: hypothetical protein H6810_03290 [Phycisphaeraceae bacterium]